MKKFLSILLTLLALLPATTFAQVDNWDGTAVQWTHGTGTQADPYLVETAENLAWIAEMVNSGVTTYEGVYFRMTTDLNLKNLEWTPIGSTNSFRGNFNGEHHFIDSLYFSSNTINKGGLFGFIRGASIQNLIIKATIFINNFTSNVCIGAIAGRANNASVNGCSNIGDMSINSTDYKGYIGGIVGYADNNTNICNATNLGKISGNTTITSAGGIVGELHSGSISRCYNYRA